MADELLADKLGLTPDELGLLTDDEINALLVAGQILALEAQEWTLQERQQRAEDFCWELATPGVALELLYGGGAGGGKTIWELYHLFRIAKRFPGTRSLMLRRTYPELRRNAIFKSFQHFDLNVCKWVESRKEWVFDNTSIIELGYLDNDLDVFNYQGADYVVIAWDELTQWPTDFCYLYMLSRLRAEAIVNEHSERLVPHVIATTNPGGIGGAWVKRRFVDIGPAETPVRETETIEFDGLEFEVDSIRVFVPALLSDNKYLDHRSYIAQLARLPKKLREALLNGSWDAIEGQYFHEWDRELHVVAPFEIPAWWTRMRGLDYGFTNPAGVLWVAFDPDDNAYLYRELYVTEHTPPNLAKRVLGMTMHNERIQQTIADPACWSKTGIGQPIATQMAQAGLHCARGRNDRKAGWARVRSGLRPDPERADPSKRGQTDDNGIPLFVPPKLYVFDTCRNFLSTFPMLVHDKNDPEDLDTDGDDHLADALRYVLMARPMRSRKPDEPEQHTEEARLAQRNRVREHMRRTRQVPLTGSGA